MVTAKLYIEGGGNAVRGGRRRGDSLEIRFRKGWKAFFKAADVGGRVKVVRGGGRKQTYDMFAAAVRNRSADTLPLLLVDSEAPVQPGHSPWQHLWARKEDRWPRPDGVGDDQAFLMVQFMETWFLADKEGLRRYFGQGFREQPIRQWQNLEEVPKRDAERVLEQATTASKKGAYDKSRDIKLLEYINPARVRAACPHADALLQRLAAL